MTGSMPSEGWLSYPNQSILPANYQYDAKNSVVVESKTCRIVSITMTER